MYSLLVLGLIPGTNISISFQAWIILMLGLAIAFKFYRRRVLEYLAMWWRSLEGIEDTRRVVHASQLHRRLHLTAR